MEWVLQVADEVDDMLGMLRHRWLGVAAGLNSRMLAGAGTEPLLLGVTAITANLAALVEIRSARRAVRA